MALMSDAAMVLFYDIEGDTADHDDWHSVEHLHERLSLSGFRRATRWVAREAAPRYLVVYEVSGLDVATSKAYLGCLDNPTPWTRAMMPRFRGMIRGFARIAASFGYGLGSVALALRFSPQPGAEERLSAWLTSEVLPAIAARRGIAGVHLLLPAAPPPMTREQALRGPDTALTWLLFATGHDEGAMRQATAYLDFDRVRSNGAAEELTIGLYALHLTATSKEVARTPAP